MHSSSILVCNRSICSLYPDSREKLFKDLFNSVIHPGCKRKQDPVSIETKSKFTSLKEWSTASQSRICFSSVSKPTISLEKLTKENATGNVPTTLKLSPLKNRDTKIF